jgi:uncharacterized protein (TIGR02757 family)
LIFRSLIFGLPREWQESLLNLQNSSDLPIFLNRLYDQYHQPEYLVSDPLEFPHRFKDPYDQEVVALVAALLAYGNVRQIRRSVEEVLRRISTLGLSPSALVRSLPEGLPVFIPVFKGFVHRFNRGEDLTLLLELLSRSWQIYGSLGAHFTSYLHPEAPDFSEALDRLILDWREWAGKRGEGSFSYLLTAPKDGSCCKRWCMFLRWMGRGEDQLDLGLWAEVGALKSQKLPENWDTYRRTFGNRFLRRDQLVIPLDTHTGRISQYLGLTSRKSLNWKAALEVTEALKKWDPVDPVRFDFALARLGILDLYRKSDLVPASKPKSKRKRGRRK